MSVSRLRFRVAACSCALALLVVLRAAGVEAQPAKEADALLPPEGARSTTRGKLAEACDALARSQALDPSVGTLGLLAACEEKRGLVARAYADFVEAARLARLSSDKREAYASERAAALAPKVARLVIRVDPSSPRPASRAPGREVPAEQKSARRSSSIPGRSRSSPPLRTAARSADRPWPPRGSASRSPSLRSHAPPPAAPPPRVEHPVTRALAFVTGGLGLVGVGVGTAFGVHAIARNDDSKACVPNAPTCPARGDALTAANASTAAFVAGIAAIGASVALFVVSRP